ncbi:MAG: hypothetical protein K2X46_08750 [Roseomonas sp.]|nr:hypothetical protein [Roseomonas sp.]MBX9700829.1 hypothetical protein [Acetobacteraceae bacterium]
MPQFAAAVRTIEGWEETPGKVETPRAKGILRDLERPAKPIRSDEPKGGRIQEFGEAVTTAAT